MTATVHILWGPAGAGKRHRLLERFCAGASARPGAALWLGPTHRAVEAVREQMAQFCPSLLGPQLLTFQGLAEDLIRVNDPAARPLSRVQRRLLLENLLAGLHRDGELSFFEPVLDTRGFSAAMAALLDEWKEQEIGPGQLARAAYRRGLRGTQVGRRFRNQVISTKDRQCLRVYARYQQWLRHQQLYDLPGRCWYARDLLARGQRRPFENLAAVFVDGFSGFSRTQNEILESLATWIEELWIALPGEKDNDRAELFTGPRAVLQRLGPWHPQIEEVPISPGLPEGLSHLQNQIFRPLRQVQRCPRAEGLLVLEAPGLLGEVRMVAREVKVLLRQGTRPEQILVTLRDLSPYADLVEEVFTEYGIPLDVEGIRPLIRNPAVATVIRALRLPEEGWDSAGVAALLRSNYFRPDWEEAKALPDLPLRAEALLRLLGERRGREEFLQATDLWADNPPSPGPEDEQAEVSRRQNQNFLARQCRPFLRRFFGAWDQAPARTTLDQHLAWLHRLAEDLGITRVAAEWETDAVALGRFWEELAAWECLEKRGFGPKPLVEQGPFAGRAQNRVASPESAKGGGGRHALRGLRACHANSDLLEPGRFSRLLTLVATEAGRARTPRGPGRVRVLSAEGARHLTADHVFLLGLGERSFPRLAQASPIYDEQERQVFKAAGLDFPCLGDRRPEEMLLFYTLLTRAQRRLVLSYPAVDDQGQALLPSSFLADLFTCFEENSLPVRKQRLLIEGYGREQPLSPAELRVRVAAQWGTSDRLTETLPPALASQLSQAALMAQQRFGHREFGPYDGRLDNPAIRAAIEERLGGPQVVSPTALETYIACPFRFLLEDLLHLEPLEELEEVIEGSDRGLIFHKALASLHRSLQAQDIHEPAAIVDTLLQQHLAAEVTRKTRHASPPAEVLWRLEGERLQKKAARYRPHWQNFLDRWAKLGLVPRPAFLEIPFGMGPVDGPDSFGPLVFQAEGVEIGLGGRIDRVDMAQTEHGTFFWIVDYKTGSSNYYTASDLKSFQKLQLTLYALAVERILLAGQGARPVGLAYWLVTDTGPKVVLPERRQLAEWLDRPERWQRVVQLLEKLVSDLVRHIRGGDFPVQPRSEKCTETCPYAQVCRISQSRSLGKMWEFPLPAL